MTALNVTATASIYGKTSVQLVTTTPTAIVTNSSGSNQLIKVNALTVANVDAANLAYITVDLYRSATAYRICYNIPVQINTAFTPLDRSYYLEEGDSIRLTSSANSRLEATCSYEVLG